MDGVITVQFTKAPRGREFAFDGERVVIWFDNPLEKPAGLPAELFPYPEKVIDQALIRGTTRLASVVLEPLTEPEVSRIRQVAIKEGTATWIRAGEQYVARWNSGWHSH